ncbi:MAG: hypothetical protein ACLQVD_10630 [Capsulimonadaceae bacterium]
MVLLVVVTLTVYGYLWMYRQIKTINAREPHAPIPMITFWICAMISAADLACEFLPVSKPIESSLDRFASLAFVAMAFIIGVGLNRVFGARRGDRDYCDGRWIFFFGMFYLQHQINRHVRDQVGGVDRR